MKGIDGMNKRFFVALLLALLVLPSLTACGKKGQPVSPTGNDAEYDRKYPAK